MQLKFPKKPALLALGGVMLLVMATTGYAAYNRLQQINAKIERIKYGIAAATKARKEPDDYVLLLKQAKIAFDSGRLAQGEALLDEALSQLGPFAPASVPAKKPLRLPIPEPGEEIVDLYETPQLVKIVDYDDDLMEPCVTGDGAFVFFNNNNSDKIETHLRIAKRMGPNKFLFLGTVAGTQSEAKDMAPSIDDALNFYFTSLRTYDSNHQSLFVGKLVGLPAGGGAAPAGEGLGKPAVAAVAVVPGDISSSEFGLINMDCCISADGNTLVISRARFEFGDAVPHESDLLQAKKADGKFVIDPDSARLYARVNTRALEYAPCLSHDGLELYFTRASSAPGDARANDLGLSPGALAYLRIMVATRASVNDAWGEPKAIKSIQGFVEAPTLTADGKEMFFHKQDHGKYCLFRTLRRKAN